ncbi:FecR domain-containing protein [Sphingomonas sp. HITSZ_GF]|uniref:FecR family protein n=1 Tax=Sphingomonas sp. HITSZ_GF TaxID=3037247 RepID=UPI00240D0E91|nr:FecR domain-containing protein [Sphingomonas sp. HITSZ_GF]MDG2535361.1 FecR domain-containing protein [Sphingomonas sp. HITSZ_GF]
MTTAFDTSSSDRDEQAALWCQALAEGALAPASQASFDRWIADPENARAFDEATQVWNAMEEVSNLPELIQLRRAALDSFGRASRDRWPRRIAPRWYWFGAVAACLVMTLMLSLVLLQDPAQAYQTGLGERRVAMLEDGSKLSLDADTRLDVRMHKDRRELTLTQGRAKFDVAKDPLRPFSVTVGDKIVVATGTSFSVEILDGQVHVLLYEGRVVVLDRASHKPVPQRMAGITAPDDQLLPGRELVVAAGAASQALVEEADLPQSLSWETGQLNFDDEPLSTAVLRMNRYSATKLAVGDAAAASARVNGVFTAGDVDAFIEAVTALAPVRAVPSDGIVTFRRK